MRVMSSDTILAMHRDEIERHFPLQARALLIRIPEAAAITGLPPSLLRKSFMCEEKRPKNVPPPPPHKRIGRAIYILARELPVWIERFGRPPADLEHIKQRRRGRPTVAERMIQRQRDPG